MTRKLLLLSVLVLSGCGGEQHASYPVPLYAPSGSSLGQAIGAPAPSQPRAAWGAGPIELRPAPPSPPPAVTQLGPPAPAPDVAHAPANQEPEASAVPQPPEEGSQAPDEPDLAQELQAVKARLEAEQGQRPAQSPASQPPAVAVQQPVSSLPTRAGFRDHYGALNHSGDVPPHSLGVGP